MDVENGAPATRELIVDGATVRFHVAGTSRHPSPPVVLVHGIGGTTQIHMGYLLPMLARRHRVISIDLAAPAEPGTELTVDRLAVQVAAVIEQEVPGLSVSLIGYSLGAVVAAALAGTRPDLVARLVLVNGWLRTDLQQSLRAEIWRMLRAENSAAIKEFAIYCGLSAEYLDLIQPVGVNRAIGEVVVNRFVDQQVQLAGRIDIADLAFAVAAPTLVIGSSKDMIAPARHARALFGAIENARYLEITAGHAALQERPAEILRAIEAFLDDPARHPAGSVLEALRP